MSAQQGLSTWDEIAPPTRIKIKVDANQQTGAMDHIGTVVHELLHIVLITLFIGFFDASLEEVCILALDANMMEYIRKSPRRLHLWEETINAKLQAVQDDHSG
jgi:hypothetical protein